MATINGLPQGWDYEPADPSVGIFQDGFYHEDCENPQVTDAEQHYTGDDLIVTCACGARIEFALPDPEPRWDD